MTRTVILLAAVGALTLSGAPAFAQEAQTPKPPSIKKAEIKPTSRASGSEMYTSYCAACHGLNGKGAGPAAPALKATMPDLTLLAKKNGGKYPSDRVASALRFGTEMPSHGSKDMPIWGPLLRSLNSSEEAEAQLRIANLVGYIETLQAK